MTSLTFRRLKQTELVKFFHSKHGKNWRAIISNEAHIPIVRMYRWFKDDISGKIQTQMELYAASQGFTSIYDDRLKDYQHHGTILEAILSRAHSRLTKEGLAKTIPGAALPLDSTEIELLLAGLNYPLLETQHA